MSRSNPLAVWLVSLLLVALTWFLCVVGQMPRTRPVATVYDVVGVSEPDRSSAANLESESPQAAALARALTLFEQGSWRESRAAYDRIAETPEFQATDPLRHAVEQSAKCSLQMADWSGALDRVSAFLNRSKSTTYPNSRWWWSDGESVDKAEAEVRRLEFGRRLLMAIDQALQSQGKVVESFRSRLRGEQTAVAFRLLSVIDPDAPSAYSNDSHPWGRRYGGWYTHYPSMDWWWEDFHQADPGPDDASQMWRWQQSGLPIDSAGQPVFRTTPECWSPELSRAGKVLWLLAEVEKLDVTPDQANRQKAILYRADLARRLYGPGQDPEWDLFYYRYAERPSFVRRPGISGLKELWQLDDHESRLKLRGRYEVIHLPESESPLALWNRVEVEFPQSQATGEAVYQRAYYFQNRRQFTRAIEEYRRLLSQFPEHHRITTAKKQLANISHSDVLLGQTGVYAVGTQPQLWFACRNTAQIEFSLRQFDLPAYMRDVAQHDDSWWNLTEIGYAVLSALDRDDDDERQQVTKHLARNEVASWTQDVPQSDQVATHASDAPLTAVGAYVLEARVPGDESVSRGLVIVTDVAIVRDYTQAASLLWIVDARTGKPLANQSVQRVRDTGVPRTIDTVTTDADGVVEFPAEQWRDGRGYRTEPFLWTTTESGGIAFCEQLVTYTDNDARTQVTYQGVTDRPLYRPGSTVQFRVWAREKQNREYKPGKSGWKFHVKVNGPDWGDALRSIAVETDETGAVSDSFDIGPEAELGEYTLTVESDGGWPARSVVGSFRVEEYRKPEFEVTVTASAKAVRLGEVVMAEVRGSYYFGAPVAGGTVHYQILRRDHFVDSSKPSEWDWLYGRGFGDYAYSYAWLGDSVMGSERYQAWDFQGWFHERQGGRLVGEGVTELDSEGLASIPINTSQAPQDRDSLYTVRVLVRDTGRRSITATGTVTVRRQPAYAFVQLDNGWYAPGDVASGSISLRTANDVPVMSEGRLSLFRVTLNGQAADTGKTEVSLEPVRVWDVRTDAGGQHRFQIPVPNEGQFRLVFEATQSGESISAAANLWSCGPDFDGRGCRFSDLELIPDQRWYRPGDTARLLIGSAHRDLRILTSDHEGRHEFVDVPEFAQIIEIPLTAEHVPNFFVNATCVRNGRLLTESCEVFVPPVRKLLNVELRTDRESYRPGQTGRVQITARDSDGRPVSGPLTLTAYDRSLTYIQRESDTGPLAFLTEQRFPVMGSSFRSTLGGRQFESFGALLCPEFHFDDGSMPQMGAMGGSPPQGGDPSDAGAGGVESARRTPDRQLDPLAVDAALRPDEIRSDFAASALWLPDVALDNEGRADVEIEFPDSLTEWRLRGAIVTRDTRVGDVSTLVVTTKPLLVRLLTPRFLVESDEVILSAIVHSSLSDPHDVTVGLAVPAAILAPVPDKPQPGQAGTSRQLVATGTIEPGSELRFDWPFHVLTQGRAEITASVRGGGEADAMRIELPVRSRAIVQTDSQAGIVPVGDSSHSIEFTIPENAEPGQSRVQLTLSPSAAATAFDAIPFLAGYPYGCVEQTMSRFYPTVLAADTLRRLGMDLEAITARLRQSRLHRLRPSAVVDSSELQHMTQAGLNRLYRFQHDDGGWGWWEHDASTPYMTAWVLHGLRTAVRAGVEVSELVDRNAEQYLMQSIRRGGAGGDRSRVSLQEQAFIAAVLSAHRSEFSSQDRQLLMSLIDRLSSKRQQLNAYGRSLLALALQHRQLTDRAREVLESVLVEVETDTTQGTAWVPTPTREYWRWYNSAVETNASVLRALNAIDPSHPLGSSIATWLAVARKNGTHWRSTRDTAPAVHALAEYLVHARDQQPAFNVRITSNGTDWHVVKVGSSQLLDADNRIDLNGHVTAPGRHRITLKKPPKYPLHYALSVQHEARPERITAAGNGISIQRRYFRRMQRNLAGDGQGDPVPAGASRTELQDGDSVEIGESIDVELTVAADADYEFLALEDRKPAGFEPVRLRSGSTWGNGLYANIELRDESVLFFANRLTRGRHVLRYSLRAETPGRFHALPAGAFDMYNPEIHARSNEMQVRVVE